MTSQDIERQRLLDVARSWLGTPYRHQASLKGIGCDCLGLVRGVWRETQGVEPELVPPYSSAWSEVGGRELLLEVGHRHFFLVDEPQAAPSDLLIFRLRRYSAAKHVGILSGNGRFIHAYDGNSVVATALSQFWLRRIAAVFRFPSVEHAEAN